MAMPDLNKGAMAPVCDEADLSERAVTGTIPTELHGILIRDGPNPLDGRFAGTDVLSWWPEAAMLHGVAFADGRCTGYRNRWVRTRRWATHADCGQTSQRLDSNPNVNVIAHAGAVLALAEGGPPVTINDRLDTLGQWQAHSSFASGMTAHPKIDPHTHELITFKADWQQPWLRYGVLDAKGQETFATQIEVSAPAMMHDMAITATHSILMDLNVGYDFQMLQRGYRLPIRWFDSRQSRLALIPRHGGPVAWFNIAPCFIQHVVNCRASTKASPGGNTGTCTLLNNPQQSRCAAWCDTTCTPATPSITGLPLATRTASRSLCPAPAPPPKTMAGCSSACTNRPHTRMRSVFLTPPTSMQRQSPPLICSAAYRPAFMAPGLQRADCLSRCPTGSGPARCNLIH